MKKSQTDHACARILPNEGVSEDLGEFTGSEWSVGLVTAESPDTFLEREQRQVGVNPLQIHHKPASRKSAYCYKPLALAGFY